MSKPKNRKRLSHREKLLLKALAGGATYAEAAALAGYSTKNARQSSFQALQAIKRTFPEALNAYGLTDDVAIEKYLKPALEAEETEFAKFEGKITDRVNVIAWGPRLQALDMLFNLKGSYAPKASDGLTLNAQNLQIVNYVARPETKQLSE